jgi:hypothetical protein
MLAILFKRLGHPRARSAKTEKSLKCVSRAAEFARFLFLVLQLFHQYLMSLDGLLLNLVSLSFVVYLFFFVHINQL